MSEWSFVTAAYALTWATFIAYAALLARRVSRARTALESGARAADGAS